MLSRFYKWLAQWSASRVNWDVIGSEAEPVRDSQITSAKVARVKNANFNTGVGAHRIAAPDCQRFTVFNAVGGHVIECFNETRDSDQYNTKSSHGERTREYSLYVIPSNKNLGKEISRIMLLEALKK